MMKTKQLNYKKGRQGEELARKFLIKKGYKLIEANYSNKLGEIDVVMSYKDALIFVEVKMKQGLMYGNPEEMIGGWKLSQIRRVAESYLIEVPKLAKKYKNYRIDAVCIVMENKKIVRISHYENIER